MGILIAIYTFVTIWLLLKQFYVAALIAILTIPFVAAFFKLKRKFLIKKYLDKIEIAKEDFKNGTEFTPFLNVNSSPWYILDLIPGVSRPVAKKLANRIKTVSKIKDFIEFANFTGLEIAFYELVKKIIKF